MAENATLTAALEYVGRGWAVIPLPHKSKKPVIPWAVYQTRRPTEGELRGWLGNGHASNLALVCGQVSGVMVLDVDGPDGEASIRGRELPPTPAVKTGKGWHYYFRHPGGEIGNKAGMLPGLDLRGNGGYVVLPPSVHPSGNAYEWTISPDDMPLADPPAWLMSLLTAVNGPTPAAPAIGETIAAGGRNATLASLAGTMRRRNLSESAILAALLEENRARCVPPLSDDEVAAIAKSVARYTPATAASGATVATPPSSATDLNAYHMTDSGQAEALAAIYGSDLRYDHTRDMWLLWDGVRWRPDIDGQRERLALDVARRRLAASASCDDDKTRGALAKWALQSENRQRLESALHLARTKQPITTTHDKLDRDAWRLACANGVLDLRSGELQPGSQADMMTLSTAIAYEPGARCDRWRAFLDEVFKGDSDLIDFIQRAAGYSLTGQTGEQCLFLCYGTGANGKSVFLSTLRLILGEYGINTRFDTFIEERNASIPNDVAALRGARLVTASEVAEGKRLNEGRIKSLTGQDPITARFLHGEYFTFQPEFKLWLAANHKPVIRGTDEAIWRRVRLIPFTAYFGPGQADPTLSDKLAAEAPGILAWAVDGCLQWQGAGLGEAQAVKTATATYRAESDLLAGFLDERTARTATATVRAGELYTAYKTWCDGNGEQPMSGQAFGRRVTERGFDKAKDRGGWWYIGLGLAV